MKYKKPKITNLSQITIASGSCISQGAAVGNAGGKNCLSGSAVIFAVCGHGSSPNTIPNCTSHGTQASSCLGNGQQAA